MDKSAQNKGKESENLPKIEESTVGQAHKNMHKWINRRKKCSTYLREEWRLLWSNHELKKHEVSPSTVAFISCRVVVRVQCEGWREFVVIPPASFPGMLVQIPLWPCLELTTNMSYNPDNLLAKTHPIFLFIPLHITPSTFPLVLLYSWQKPLS